MRSNPSSSSQLLPSLLPPVRPGSGNQVVRVAPSVVSEESTRIVGTAKKSTRAVSSNEGSEKKDEDTGFRKWTKQRLISEGVENTKVGWENEIARHILSVYASTNALKNLNESNNLLDFVGDRTQQNRSKSKSKKKKFKKKFAVENNDNHVEYQGVNDDNDDDDDQLVYAVPQFHRNYQDHIERESIDAAYDHTSHHKRIQPHRTSYDFDSVQNMSEQGDHTKEHDVDSDLLPSMEKIMLNNDEENDELNEVNKESTTHEGPQRKLVKKKKKTTPKATSTSNNNKNKALDTKQEEERRLNERYIQTLLNQIALHSAGLTESQRQYRVTNTIKLRDGRDITVRGPPKVNPIWFCSSGDVYCDWTALPGGKRLQAHLSLLYEKNMFIEYLQLLQMLLLRLYRRAAYGEESFTAGTFGLQERYGQTRVPPAHIAPKQANTNQESIVFRVNSANTNNRRDPNADEAWFDPLLRMQLSSPLRRQAQHRYETEMTQQATHDTPTNNYNTHVDINEDGNNNKRTLRQERLFSPGDPLYNTTQVEEPVLTIPELRLLWRQLLMASIAIGILCTEKGGALFDRGMDCFTLCDTWLRDYDELIPLKRDRKEMKAFIQDGMAFYFYKRKRSLAARAFSDQAMALFQEVENAEMEAQCLLHIAAVQCQLSQFKESHGTLYHFLAMVETGRLAFAQATPKQLCMVAVAYHNLAVIQLKMDAPDLACKSSQNARKISRLCLAQSNRWIDVFQYTHEIALADMKYELSTRTLDEMTPQQILLVRELAEALFAPDVVING